MFYRIITFLICIILTTALLSGCVSYFDVRPKMVDGEIWVCQEPYSYFCANVEDQIIKGEIHCDDVAVNFNFDSDSGARVYFYKTGYSIDGKEVADYKNLLLSGTAEYHEGYFDFTVKEDPDNLFDGELPVMRFTRYTPEEFEEKFDTLEPGEDTLS